MSTNDPAIHAASTPAPRPRADRRADHGSFLTGYKWPQGYWTRVLSGVGAATLVLAGVAWLWAQMQRIQENTIYWQAGMAIAVIAIFGSLIWYLLNKPKVADFLIATEAEMKKVNWPSWREIIGSTIVVIAGTFLIAALLFVIDLFFGWLFIEIGILEAAQAGLEATTTAP